MKSKQHEHEAADQTGSTDISNKVAMNTCFFFLSSLSNCHIIIMSLGEVEFESQLQIPSELLQKSILTACLVYLEPLVVSKSVLGMILYKKMERA